MNIPNNLQEARVLEVLKKGGKVSKRYFVQTMMLSQAGRALHNLQHNPKWQAEYQGYTLKSTEERDEYNFCYWYLEPIGQMKLL